ncbi:hypothetical protein BC751_0539 [Cecembia calidifontis]|uniref:ATP synthase protein I n=2 Tax=Cecembia calidifontis TaxID=1187080 RepID=A0A4Q7P526_9BACT|nr:hypothetical protein BC751_0539 [Cecembia calidifontis]
MHPYFLEMKQILNLTVKLLLLTLTIAGLVYLIKEVFHLNWVHESIWKIISFFLILTWLTGIFAHYLLSISKENSANILMGTIGIRFLASIAFVVVMLVLGQENLILFVINFFVIYLFYLLFDMYGLITNLRPISK